MVVNDILDTCRAEVVGEDHKNACLLGWGQESIPAMCRPLQSTPVFNLTSNGQLDLSKFGLNQKTLNTIQDIAQSMFHEKKVRVGKTVSFAQHLSCKLYS